MERRKKKIGLVGNPNVGKSTVFNALTGLNQHTGNWTGKTVTNAVGTYEYEEEEYELVDLPGTYSLISHSAEEEVTRDFVLGKNYEAIVVVCDGLVRASCRVKSFGRPCPGLCGNLETLFNIQF